MNKGRLKIKSLLYKYGVVAIGSLSFAIAVSVFLDPNRLAPGGVAGIAIIINHYTSLSTGALVLCMNVPLMLVGVWKFGMKFLVPTIISIIMVSAFIDVAATFEPLSNDLLVCTVIGGVLSGTGLGIIFKVGATTGGTDIVARLLKLKLPHVETGRLFIIIDTVIVFVSAVAFGDIEVAVYAGIGVFIAGKVFDMVLYGGEGAKLIFVISDKEDVIARRILEELESGVTYVRGIGAFTESEKKIIMCALKKQMLPKAEDIIKEIDVNAFIIITSANEIVGEGYKSPYAERI